MEPGLPGSILIVGVDACFCYLLRSYVQRCTWQSLFSLPGSEVLEITRRERPAAIVMDMDMPQMAGWSLLRALKASPATCETPVVICAWLDERERGALEGANACLRMPVLYVDFLQALQKVGVSTSTMSH